MLDTLARSVRTAVRTTRAAVRYVREDVRTARAKDPAARSVPEVLTYPGLHAVWLHRVEHWLWERGFRFAARLSSQVSRFLTGVEIHPAAEIGRRLFVDHGMGVVIGETSEIGDDVLLYHGVTLGGGSMRRKKRHPTVADGATVGANATLVGDITIGEGATVGAGSVVVEDVPPRTTVAGNPAAVVDTDGEAVVPYGVEPGADRGGEVAAESADTASGDDRSGDDGSTEDAESASGEDDGVAGACS